MMIGIVCFLIAVCICTGAVQHFINSSAAENTTDEITISDITHGSVDSESSSETEMETAPNTAGVSTEKPTAKESKKADTSTTAKRETGTEKKHTETSVSETEKKETTTAPKKQEIVVTFSINSSKAYEYGADVPKYMLAPTPYTAENGATAFDALSELCSKNNLQLSYQSKSYILSIGGLAEKDCGAASGWMYKINGKKPNMSASKYVLKNGDTVEWYYVTSAKD